MKNLISVIVLFFIFSFPSFSQSGLMVEFKNGFLLGEKRMVPNSTKLKRGTLTHLGIAYNTSNFIFFGGSISNMNLVTRSSFFTKAFVGYNFFFGKKKKLNIPIQIDYGVEISQFGRNEFSTGMSGGGSLGVLYLIDKSSQMGIGLSLERYYSFKNKNSETGLSLNVRYFLIGKKSNSDS